MNAFAKITTDQLTELRADVLAVAGSRTFDLPDADMHVVGVSSGNDSTAVALVMGALFGHLDNLHYVFTDTGVEVEGTEEQLAKIEELTGKTITRLSTGYTLFDLIERNGNYLPSQRARYCTRQMKIMPLAEYFDAKKAEGGEGFTIASYVGIRADEPGREGGQYGDGGTKSYFPLQALGFDRSAVYELVNKWVGIPAYYAAKSRSGCEICCFSRRSEVLARLERGTDIVRRAANMEGLSEADKAKLIDLPPSVMEQTGVARNHFMMAMPASLLPGEGPQSDAVMLWETFRAKADTSNNFDMFAGTSGNSKKFFVAVQMRVGWLGAGNGYECYFQDYITHSTSLGGIKTAMKHYWLHRLNTLELMGLESEQELRDGFRIAIFEVELNDADHHLAVNTDGVYTWQNDGQPLLLLRKTRHLLEQILLTEGLRQGLADRRAFVRKESEEMLEKVTSEYGRVLWSQAYEPPSASDLQVDIDIEDAPVVCNTCSR